MKNIFRSRLAVVMMLLVVAVVFGTKNVSTVMALPVVTPHLIVTQHSSYANLDTYDSSSGYFLVTNFDCRSSTSCLVTDLTFQGYLDDDGDYSSLATSSAGTTHGSSLADYLYAPAPYIETVSVGGGTTYTLVDRTVSIDPVNFTVNVDGDFTIPANSVKTLYLQFNIDSSAAFSDGDSENMAFSLSPSNVRAVYATNKNLRVLGDVNGTLNYTVSNIDPNGSLDLTLNTAAGTQTVAVGSTNVEMLNFDATCNNFTGCTINEFPIQTFFDAEGDANSFVPSGSGIGSSYIANYYLVDLTAGSVVATSSGTPFTGLSIPLTDGEIKTFSIEVDISSSAYDNGDPENLAIGLDYSRGVFRITDNYGFLVDLSATDMNLLETSASSLYPVPDFYITTTP